MTFRIGDFVRSSMTGRPYKIIGFERLGFLSAVLAFVSWKGKTYLRSKRLMKLPVDTLVYDERRRWRNPTPRE